MAPRPKVQGVDDARRAFRELARNLAAPMNEASKRSLDPTLAAAKENVPVRTGRLKRALAIVRAKDSPKTKPRYFVGPDRKRKVFYGHLVEWGRPDNADGKGGVKGTRFLTRAFDSTKTRIPQIWGATIGPAIEKHAARLAQRKAKRR
jgi:hypothetical protein